MAEPALRAEYVHQLRVGIRRLRSCHKLFAGDIRPLAPRIKATLRRSFLVLGASRDAEIVRREIAPRLELAGMPMGRAGPSPRKPEPDTAAALAASPGFQTLLLDLMAAAVLAGPDTAGEADAASGQDGESGGRGGESVGRTAPPQGPDAAPPDTQAPPEARKVLARKLDKWLRQIVKPGQDFASLGAEAQHTLRKRAKRLRYGLGFAAPFLDQPRQRRIVAALARVQAALGELNDLYVAERYYRNMAKARPQAWFAVGWLRAMQQQQKDAAQEAFAALAASGRLKSGKR